MAEGGGARQDRCVRGSRGGAYRRSLGLPNTTESTPESDAALRDELGGGIGGGDHIPAKGQTIRHTLKHFTQRPNPSVKGKGHFLAPHVGHSRQQTHRYSIVCGMYNIAKAEVKNTGMGTSSANQPRCGHAIRVEIMARATGGIRSMPQLEVGMKPTRNFSPQELHLIRAMKSA